MVVFVVVVFATMAFSTMSLVSFPALAATGGSFFLFFTSGWMLLVTMFRQCPEKSWH
jgi:hypothetical protein